MERKLEAYMKAVEAMKENPTDGSEYCNGIVLPNTVVGHTQCQYCKREVLGVWDKHNLNGWNPYLGNQARRPNTYVYSSIIQCMRKHFGVEGKVWTDEMGNNLLNVHARVHSQPTNWLVRGSHASVRILCNKCFQKTYQRVKIMGDDGILYAISVLQEREETVHSVMLELGISGKLVGKGGIVDYTNP